MRAALILWRRRWVLAASVAVWIGLWRHLSAANLLSGVVVSSAVVLAFARRDAGEHRGTFRPLAALRFAVWFIGKLLQASAVLTWEVLTPRNRIAEGIIAVPLRGLSDGLTVLVADAISLIPGTVTLEVRRDKGLAYIHVLHLHDLDAARAEVLHLEELAIRAFGSAEALRQLEQQRRTHQWTESPDDQEIT